MSTLKEVCLYCHHMTNCRTVQAPKVVVTEYRCERFKEMRNEDIIHVREEVYGIAGDRYGPAALIENAKVIETAQKEGATMSTRRKPMPSLEEFEGRWNTSPMNGRLYTANTVEELTLGKTQKWSYEQCVSAIEAELGITKSDDSGDAKSEEGGTKKQRTTNRGTKKGPSAENVETKGGGTDLRVDALGEEFDSFAKRTEADINELKDMVESVEVSLEGLKYLIIYVLRQLNNESPSTFEDAVEVAKAELGE